jgi:hypothetical protein
MISRKSAVLLLVIQLVLVLSVAAQFLLDRETCPRIWIRAKVVDPVTPLRGRYLALEPLIDGCSLLHQKPFYSYPESVRNSTTFFSQWDVTIHAEHGQLIPQKWQLGEPRYTTMVVRYHSNEPCTRMHLSPGIDFYIPDNATQVVNLKHGQELWVEATIPHSGPPRPINLAISDASGFRPLRFE